MLLFSLSTATTDYEQSRDIIQYTKDNPCPETGFYEANSLIAGKPELAEGFMEVYPVFLQALPGMVGKEIASIYYFSQGIVSLIHVLGNDRLLKQAGVERIFVIEYRGTF